MLTNSIRIYSTFVKERVLDAGRAVGEEMQDKVTLMNLVLTFFIFSFVGWSWEVALHLWEDGMFVNRGVLYGPWLPIYGTGGVLLMTLLRPLFHRPLMTFGAIMGACGIMEYITGWYLETFLGARWWDYRDMPFNIQGRVCLAGLLIFGVGGCLYVYFLAPRMKRLFDKIPESVKKVVCVILMILFIVDAAYSGFILPNQGVGISIQ